MIYNRDFRLYIAALSIELRKNEFTTTKHAHLQHGWLKISTIFILFFMFFIKVFSCNYRLFIWLLHIAFYFRLFHITLTTISSEGQNNWKYKNSQLVTQVFLSLQLCCLSAILEYWQHKARHSTWHTKDGAVPCMTKPTKHKHALSTTLAILI